ncbi:Flagellar protein FliT [Arsenophonus endosymbiont of Aleurodicus floccissimus]|uniref:flagellar protein FliT n=1 Tax=Arsenophonus endosymbiont of Aleurodicus floccissimus TaxID=2152761 RepID=UPI000E6B1749|nr:flagellar protein FliT [Arsenophonus endosymbiont of Aleurodicus floccissimus]SPP31069.1 Flagellar protein FliT [Arsenophonus endosymbiont of Aleurodicus floccissimus]
MSSEQQTFLYAYQQAQWEQLLIVEPDYRQAVGQVTALGSIIGLTEPLQHKLTKMLQTILRDESEIRQLMHSRVNQLATSIRQTTQQQ